MILLCFIIIFPMKTRICSRGNMFPFKFLFLSSVFFGMLLFSLMSADAAKQTVPAQGELSKMGLDSIPVIVKNLPPVIQEVTGPSQLQVGEEGTWTVTARDPENGYLRYKVLWNGAGVLSDVSSFPSKSHSFSHRYFMPGTYYPVFVVTDDQGLSANGISRVVVQEIIPDPGEIVFAIDSTYQDVPAGTFNHSFGNLTISHQLQEGVQITNGLTFVVNYDGSCTTPDDVVNQFENFHLVNTNTGAIVFHPANPVIIDDLVIVALSDQPRLRFNQTLEMDMVADIRPDAMNDCEIGFELLMPEITITGLKTGLVSTGGPDGTGPHPIKPIGNPISQFHRIIQNTLHITPYFLADDTYVARQDGALVWKGVFRTEADEYLMIRKLEFAELSTAVDGDIAECALFRQDGTISTGEEFNVPMVNGRIVLNFLGDDGVPGLLIPGGTEQVVYMLCDIGRPLSAPEVFLTYALDVSEIDVENIDGGAVPVANTDDVPGANYTLVESGTLEVALNASLTPDNAILIANDDGASHAVGAFEFHAEDEDINIEDLTIDINEVDTAYLGVDIPNDTRAIDHVGLFYDDGTPVLKNNGSQAETSAVATGEAFLQDLDLIIERDEDKVLFVKVVLNRIYSADIARSGMGFEVNLSFEADEYDIRGDVSGMPLTDDTLFVDYEPTDDTHFGNEFYVLTNRVIAENASTSTVLVQGTQTELMRLNMEKLVDTKDAYLRKLTIDIDTIGEVTVENVRIYNEENQVIAVSGVGAPLNSRFKFIVGQDSLDIDFNNLRELPWGSGEYYDEIDGVSETYVVRADITTDGFDDAIIASIDIYDAPVMDYYTITWRDEGTNNGEDGFNMPWIDLGDSPITQIQNILSN